MHNDASVCSRTRDQRQVQAVAYMLSRSAGICRLLLRQHGSATATARSRISDVLSLLLRRFCLLYISINICVAVYACCCCYCVICCQRCKLYTVDLHTVEAALRCPVHYQRVKQRCAVSAGLLDAAALLRASRLLKLNSIATGLSISWHQRCNSTPQAAQYVDSEGGAERTTLSLAHNIQSTKKHLDDQNYAKVEQGKYMGL